MTDFETVAAAEDRSRAWAELQDLIDEYGPVTADANGVLRFPVSSEGENQ